MPTNDLVCGGLAALALTAAMPALAEPIYESYELTFGRFEAESLGAPYDFTQSGGAAETEWQVGRVRLATGLEVLRYDEDSTFTVGTETYVTAGYQITPRLTAGATVLSYDLRAKVFDPAPRVSIGAFAEYRATTFDTVLYARTEPDDSASDYIYLGGRYSPADTPWSVTGSVAIYPDDSAVENTLRVSYRASDWQATAFYYNYDPTAGSDVTALGAYGHYDPAAIDRLRLRAGLRRGTQGSSDWWGLSLGVGYEVLPDGYLVLGYDLRDVRGGDYSERGILIGFEMDLGARGLLHQEMFDADREDIRRTGGEWYD